MQGITHKISNIDNRVVNLEKFAEYTSSTLSEFDQKMKTVEEVMEEKIKKEAHERLKLEMWGRKWNLVFRGIPGKLDETPRVTEMKVRESFEKQLGISNERANVMLLTAVHRLPGGMDENKRNCIVRFSSLMDRDEVLQKGIALKPGSGYSVVPDLPPSVSILRSKLLNEKRNMSPDEKKRTKLIYIKEYPFVRLVRKTSR